jgi:hypothetical protein
MLRKETITFVMSVSLPIGVTWFDARGWGQMPLQWKKTTAALISHPSYLGKVCNKNGVHE